MKPIRKAVFPVAGMGTRFLPATKASPKEMLPVVDKPLIQYAVEEAVAAGITELVFVTGRSKRAIEDHFDKAYELETELELRNKHRLLDTVRGILPRNVSCLYIRQTEALGLGHAVLCARPAVGDEPFAVILADDLVDSPSGAVAELVGHYQTVGASVLGVERVDPRDTGSYGIVEVVPAEGSQRVTSISLWPAAIAVPRWRSGIMPRVIGCRIATSTPRSSNRWPPTISGSDPGYWPSGPSVPPAYSPPGAPYQSIS